jgi:hypothetical protein
MTSQRRCQGLYYDGLESLTTSYSFKFYEAGQSLDSAIESLERVVTGGGC